MSADDVLNRAEAALERARTRDVRRRLNKGAARVKRAVKYVVIGMAAILLVAIIWGMVTPIGVTGVLAVMLAFMTVIVLSVLFSHEPEVRSTALVQTPIKALPDQTARWLDQQRILLPARAQRLADGIGVKLAALGPQLATLDDREPAAAEVRRLIATELPELVSGYARVPDALRRVDTDGMMPERQLINGLNVVDAELSRMSEALARGDLEKLATQGKYLELKYQGEGLG